MNLPIHPPDWPRCPTCGDYARVGWITCGLAGCGERRWSARAQLHVCPRCMQPVLDAVAAIEGWCPTCRDWTGPKLTPRRKSQKVPGSPIKSHLSGTL